MLAKLLLLTIFMAGGTCRIFSQDTGLLVGYDQRIRQLLDAQNVPEAFDLVQQTASKQTDHNGGPATPETALNGAWMGDMLRRTGRYDEAEGKINRALQILKASPIQSGRIQAEILDASALLRRDQQKNPEAEQLFRQALALRQKTLGPEHPETRNSFYNLAGFLWGVGKPSDALALFRQAAETDEHWLVLNLSKGTESEQLDFAEQVQKSTDLLLSYALAYPKGDASNLAFEAVVRRKGRVLDNLAQYSQNLRRHVSLQGQKLLDRLTQVRAEEAGLVISNSNYERFDQLVVEEDELTKELGALNTTFLVENQPISVHHLQSLLATDAILLEYIRYRPYVPSPKNGMEWEDAHYGVFALTEKDSSRFNDLGQAASIEAAVGKWRDTLAKTPFNNPDEQDRVDKETRGLAPQLADELLGPRIVDLRSAHRLLIAPDGELNLLPWSALPVSPKKLLLDSHEISLLNTGRDLLHFGQSVKPRSLALVLAYPAYSKTPPETPTDKATVRASEDFITKQDWPDLSGTHSEAREVSSLLHVPQNRQLEGLQANKSALQQLHGPWILHVATHGYFLPDEIWPGRGVTRRHSEKLGDILFVDEFQDTNPLVIVKNPLLRTGLIFAGANIAQNRENSIMTGLEIAQLDLDGTELVVLSACETGLGDAHTGEGVFGFRRAVALAGAQAEVLSLWKVNDPATAELMTRFYRHLTSGMGRSASLAAAQREMRVPNGTYHNAHYWAAFELIGNPAPLANPNFDSQASQKPPLSH